MNPCCETTPAFGRRPASIACALPHAGFRAVRPRREALRECRTARARTPCVQHGRGWAAADSVALSAFR